jgi:lipid-A-disaccharide synthase
VTPARRELLVVAGEPSGDALAAQVVARLGVATFGLGGPRLSCAGTDIVADLRAFAAMGISAVALRAPRVVRAVAAVVLEAKRRRPTAALLVGFSEVNAWIAAWLKRRGTRVLWYAPPQVWAWRPARAKAIAARCDALALLLPFEKESWACAGAAAEYVGHPATECDFLPAPKAAPATIALLPGSRPHEVRAHLEPLLGAAERLAAHGHSSRLVIAEALERGVAGWAAALARARGVEVTHSPCFDALRSASVAVVASGTATLECAAAGVPPVVVYRTDPLTFAVAAHSIRVAHIGLPNLVLGRRAFPELVQNAVTAAGVGEAVRDVLAGHGTHRESCREVRHALLAPLDARSPSERVASTLRSWVQ